LQNKKSIPVAPDDTLRFNCFAGIQYVFMTLVTALPGSSSWLCAVSPTGELGAGVWSCGN